LRVFAGPNGSGKSTIINSIRNIRIKGAPIDFGVYINADEIAEELRNNCFCFSNYTVGVGLQDFEKTVLESGLIGKEFPETRFKNCYSLCNNRIRLTSGPDDERLAQIVADFLRKRLLKERKKFSFETVFSHTSKVDIIKEAEKLGYKVYLYFISTENPEINVYRVKEVRIKQKGHDVPEEKIRSRYYRSMNLLYQASQYAYQSYYFDNSADGKDYRLFAHFKLNRNGEKIWDKLVPDNIPIWFYKYYIEKAKNQ